MDEMINTGRVRKDIKKETLPAYFGRSLHRTGNGNVLWGRYQKSRLCRTAA